MARVTRVAKAQKDQGRCDYPACEHPTREIRRGESYIWIKPRESKARPGHKRVRHGDHPAWQVWEYSDSLSAQVARIQHEHGDASGFTEVEEVTSALEDAAAEVEEIASAKREGAENIESGFGHATSTSEELAGQADSLESWAEEIRNADVPELPEPEETDHADCEGRGFTYGEDGQQIPCEECDGGTFTPDEPTEEQMDAWREEVQALLDDTLGNSPV